MNKIEYKVVRFRHSLSKRLIGDDYDEAFDAMLAQHGNEGWDLKSTIREHGLRTLLIFGRETPDAAKN